METIEDLALQKGYRIGRCYSPECACNGFVLVDEDTDAIICESNRASPVFFDVDEVLRFLTDSDFEDSN